MNRIVEFIDTNGRWVTFFTVAAVLILGVTLVDDPSSGLSALLVLACFGALSVLWLVKRSVFKAVAVVVCVLLEGSSLVDGASYLPTSSDLALRLSFLHVAVFLVLLSVSLSVTSRIGRWGPLFVSTLVGFMVVSLQLATGVPALVCYASVVLVPSIVFGFTFFGSRKNAVRMISMPRLTMTHEDAERHAARFIKKGYGATVSSSLTDAKSLVVWNDETAFALHETVLDSAFTMDVDGNLQHEGEPIDSWLSRLADKTLPLRRFGSVPVMIVLLDKNGKNGKKTRVIGVTIPNSSGVIPVGVVPASKVDLTEPSKAFTSLTEEFSTFTKPLSKLQVRRLDMTLPGD